MQNLIKKLRKELYSKPSPGKILNDMMDKKLKEFAKQHRHDEEALWIGSYLADMKITEALETGDITKHVPMASKYARQIFKQYSIPEDKQEIILEIIEKHHEPGPYEHIETRLFVNADCFKFLEPKGAFHLFGAMYGRTNQDFDGSMQYVMFKAKEKYSLVDLDEKTKEEAEELYARLKWMFDRIGVKEAVPEVYQKS
ncbi:hypothetical protein JW978_01320 [Candidatus Dojkabacteria bacterium]|nr:hypothetical protein [Candidatus Dojkabacteria bacterium]